MIIYSLDIFLSQFGTSSNYHQLILSQMHKKKRKKKKRRNKKRTSKKESCVCVLSCFSHVWLFATLWTAANQAPLSMGFSRQEYWRGFPFPPPGDLPDPGIKPMSFKSPALGGGFFTTSTTWEAHWTTIKLLCYFVFKRYKLIFFFRLKKLWGYSWLTMLCCFKHTETWISYADLSVLHISTMFLDSIPI